MPPNVAIIHRVLSSGSSFSSLVGTEDGRRYVLKLSGAGSGRRALATEFVALKCARCIGLNVPNAEVLAVARNLPWQTGTDEFYEAVQRSAGLNLGVAFIAEAHDVAGTELDSLPDIFADRLAAVDALLQNVDRTRANPNILRGSAGAYWAIDFGACLLIDRLARGDTRPRTTLPPNHLLAGRRGEEAVRGLAGLIDKEVLQQTIDALPDDWLADIGLPRTELFQRLTNYLLAMNLE